MTRALTIAMGIPGCGKSTWGETLVETNIISPDNIRYELTGDMTDQSKNNEVFDLAYARVKARLWSDQRVYFDATTLLLSSYNTLLGIAREVEAPVVAVKFDVPLDIAKERNANRERVVPEHVLDKYQKRFDSFDWTHVINTADHFIVVNEHGDSDIA